MASKVKSGKLTTTVSESVVINGVEQKYNNVRTVAGINNVSHRIVRTDASGTELTLMNFAASVDAGQFIDGQAKYIRITNLDDTNLLRLLVKDAAGIATFHLAAGETMVFNNQKYDARNDADLNSVAYTDIDSISVFGRDAADAANAAVDVEYFVAAIQS
tara:strand:+ start:100 stop:579 length:480 start_codon:yes stop_codon:yes gene_type:complete